MDDLDRRVVAMAGAHAVVTARQLSGHLRLEVDQLEASLLKLCARGLLREERLAYAADPVFRVTHAGLSQAGSRLRAPGFVLDDLRGQSAAVMLWVAALDGGFGEMARVLSAREMAGLDEMAASSAAVPCGFLVSVAGVGVYPDLALVSAGGHRVAVHLMLWPFRPSALAALVEAYEQHSEPPDAVLIFVSTHQVRLEVTKMFAGSPLADRLHVRVANAGAMGLPDGGG